MNKKTKFRIIFTQVLMSATLYFVVLGVYPTAPMNFGNLLFSLWAVNAAIANIIIVVGEKPLTPKDKE